jgi:hypothetical protein
MGGSYLVIQYMLVNRRLVSEELLENYMCMVTRFMLWKGMGILVRLVQLDML